MPLACVFVIILLLFLSHNCLLTPNLPQEHLPYYYKTFPLELDNCIGNSNVCIDKINFKKFDGCWGYEDDCPTNKSFLQPLCSGDHKGWVRTQQEQLDTFYAQADFGYVRAHRNSIQIICEPTFRDDTALECSEHLQFCRGRNLFLNLTTLDDLGSWRYKMDVLKPGDLGGWCLVHQQRLDSKMDHMSPLQSWAPEMRNFQVLPRRLNVSRDCDVYIEKPTFVMKIDATVNMYHHLCDFLNLYASLHVNSTHPSTFSSDVQIIIWETYPYYSAFRDIWPAFTDHPLLTLHDLSGKTVCFRNAVFPLLPRMIFGLYYNTPLVRHFLGSSIVISSPIMAILDYYNTGVYSIVLMQNAREIQMDKLIFLIYGCEGSGLFKAFSQFIVHRLGIAAPAARNSTHVRVTLLSRETTHRNIVNEAELLGALRVEPGVTTRRVVFNHKTPFREQLAVIRETDVFIGMHGAGLTHLLFLPDWAAVFELYNCEDDSCYLDLARLRGVKYTTWSDQDKVKAHGNYEHPEGGAHAKFTNYSFDVEEFMRIVRILLEHVRSHSDFVSERPENQSIRDEL